MPSSGLGLLTDQSLPAASSCPGPEQVPEGVLPRRPSLAEERDGQLVHLRLVGGPERLNVGDRLELREPRQVVGVHNLEVREVVAAVGRPVGLAGRLDRVERLANGAVAEGVEVHLETGCVELGHVVAQRDRVDEAQAGVVGGTAVVAEVGLEHRGREVLGDAVLHDLHAGGGEASHPPLGPTGDQLGDLLGTPVPLPPEGADHPCLEVTGSGGRQVDGIDVVEAEQASDGGVLPSGDTE